MGWRWFYRGLLFLCVPCAAWAGNAAVRVTPLPFAPVLAAGHVAASAAGKSSVAQRAWLHAPHAQTAWYELRLAQDWRAASPPLLSIHGNVRARVTAYLPPDYRPRSNTVFDAALDPTFSHDSVVYALPADLRADQPIYLELGDPGQTQPIRAAITDLAG